MMRDRALNPEGYSDPTFFAALREIEDEEYMQSFNQPRKPRPRDRYDVMYEEAMVWLRERKLV